MGHGAWGMGNWELGMGHGAWGMGNWALSKVGHGSAHWCQLKVKPSQRQLFDY
ncbi:MAG: hypothetical protein QQW96_25770 [Tychonema bourrellyi B0820]|nr:hypothetical protein [Tychonema bourrellyi B0820]